MNCDWRGKRSLEPLVDRRGITIELICAMSLALGLVVAILCSQ